MLPHIILSLSFAHIFLLDFNGEFSLGDHFNGFVVRTLQGVSCWSPAWGTHWEQAEFNTRLCFVSGQSKPTTPLQSPGPSSAPPLHQEPDSEVKPAQCLLHGL